MEKVNNSTNNSISVELNEKCPVCKKELKPYSLNFEESLKMCPDQNCSYPFLPSDSFEINKVQITLSPSDCLVTATSNSIEIKCGDDKNAMPENVCDFNLDDIISPLTDEDEINKTDLNNILNDLMTSFESHKFGKL